MKKRHITAILLLSLTGTVQPGSAQDITNRLYQQEPVSWLQSNNPAGIHYIPADSMLEASIGYHFTRNPLPASGQPRTEQNYGAKADGFLHIGELSLSGGLGWEQSHRKGQRWNLLTSNEYLITAGDSLGEPVSFEQYYIHGKVAYAFTPDFIAGLGGSYAATANRNDTPKKRYSGREHELTLSAGLVYQGSRLRSGLCASYTHRTERLSFNGRDTNPLISFHPGYFIMLKDLTSILYFQSTGNSWQVALQAGEEGKTFSWYNELQATGTYLSDNPGNSIDQLGWKEKQYTLGYNGQFSYRHTRHTQRVTPLFLLQQGTADRILQHVNPDNLTSPQITFATIRLCGRQQVIAGLHYELARNYQVPSEVLACEFSAYWHHYREELYSYPLTVSSRTGTFHSELAFRRTFPITPASHLTLRPSIHFSTGGGELEKITSASQSTDVRIDYQRSYTWQENDFSSRTASRLGIGTYAEYRRQLSRTLAAGLCLHAGIQKVMTGNKGTGGEAGLSIKVWL